MRPLTRQVPQRGVRGGGLAAAGLADQAVGLAGATRNDTPAQHGAVDAPNDVRDLEVGDLEGGALVGREASRVVVLIESDTAWMESAIRLTAITRLAMASAGNIVGHHWPDRDEVVGLARW